MVTHNISSYISETVLNRDFYSSKKAERFSNEQHFLTETIRQCVKIYQLEPRDWQQFYQAIHPSLRGDISLENKHNSKALVSGFKFALAAVHQCIQIMHAKPIVWQQFYRG